MKEYSIAALVSAVLVPLLDRALRTRVLSRWEFWVFMGAMMGFKIVANGYLTWRPIVLYGSEFNLGVRLGTIPIEDFFYGFSLIASTVIVWEYLRRKEQIRASDRPSDKKSARMHPYLLEHRQVLPAPLEQVFAFFRSPENLARITPARLRFTILTPPPIRMKEGALIDYTIRLAGVPVRWTTLITSYEPPYRFVDEQIRGPYSFWHHTHAFREVGGGTEMTDTVRYLLPGGQLGRMVHAVFVRRQLQQIFEHRAATISRMFTNVPLSEENR